MAYRGYRVVCFTPAGRKRTMSVLADNLSRFTDVIDEWQVWLNTDPDQVEDTKWLRKLPKLYDWVRVIEPTWEPLTPKQLNTGLFYPNTVDPKTIYIRFDDDIVYIDDDFFVNLLDFRIDNPDYFLIMANIWNNAITSYIQQDLGVVWDEDFHVEEPYCMEPTAWRSGPFAALIHYLLIEAIKDGTTSQYFFDRADLEDVSRFSISCFCFFGKDFAKFKGIVGQRVPGKVRWDEEVWLTEVFPTINKVKNTICGSALVSHYSFFPQRPYLDTTPILEDYTSIAKQKLSINYYDLLEGKTHKAKKLKGLKKIVLPKPINSYASYADSLAAEKAGYSIVDTDYGYDIIREGKVVKSLRGEVNEWSADRALVQAWKGKM